MNAITKNSFYSATTLVVLALVAILIGWLSAQYQYGLIPFMIVGSMAGLFIVMATFISPYHGLVINLIVSFFIFLPQRILGLQYSLALIWEIHLLICFLAILIHMKGKRMQEVNKALFKNPITWFVIIYLVYMASEIMNPNVPDAVGYLYTLRRTVVYVLSFFTSYYILDNVGKMNGYVKALMALIILATLYAYYQQTFGFLPFEITYINQSPEFYNLLYQWGITRKFSFLDVTTYPMLSNLGALILIIFAFYEKKTSRLILYIAMAVFLVIGSTFSGTRSSSYIVPLGLLLYSVINIRKPKSFFVYLGVLLAIFITINLPVYRFNTLNRYRSAFSGEDASLDIRNINRARIQPYIHEHAFGGGLATAGATGQILYPGHPLAGFAADSGLLLSAVEKGWLGLAFDMLLYLMILVQGAKGYFRTQNDASKKYYLAITCGLFSLILVEYAQVVILQIPLCMFFFPGAAMIIRLRYLDQLPETLLIKTK
jgi:putative inorganic carbon (hco3(-)) transporter